MQTNISQNFSECRKMALILGNNSYQNLDKLTLCKKDAELMDSTLQSLGFTTNCFFDLKNQQLKHEIREFGDSLKNGDVVFFYYSGNAGQQSSKNSFDNFLFGIDAEKEVYTEEREKQVYSGVSLKNVVFRSFHQYAIFIIVLDACRKTLSQSIKFKSGDGAVPMNENSPTFGLSLDCLPEDIKYNQFDIIFACQPGKYAEDKSDREFGYLAAALSDNMRKPQKWGEALVNVIQQVYKESSYRQQPSVSLNIAQQIQFVAQPSEQPHIMKITQEETGEVTHSDKVEEAVDYVKVGHISEEIQGYLNQLDTKVTSVHQMLQFLYSQNIIKTDNLPATTAQEIQTLVQPLEQKKITRRHDVTHLNQNIKKNTTEISENIQKLQQVSSIMTESDPQYCDQLSDMQSQLNLVMQRTQMVMTENEYMKKKYNDMNTQLFQLQQAFNSQQKHSDIQNQIHTLGDNLQEYNDQIQNDDNLTVIDQKNYNSIQNLSDLINQLQSQFSELLAKFQQVSQNRDNQAEQAQGQMQEQGQGQGQLLNQGQVQGQGLEEFMDYFQQVQNQLNNLKNDAQLLIQEVQQTKIDNQQLRSKISQLQNTFDETQIQSDDDSQSQQIQYQKVQNQLNKFVEQQIVKNEEIEHKNQQNVQNMQLENALNVHNVNSSIQDQQNEQEILKLCSQEQLLLDQIEELKKQISQITNEKQQLENEKKNIENDNNLLYDQLNQLQSQFTEKEENFKNLKLEQENLLYKLNLQHATSMQEMQKQHNAQIQQMENQIKKENELLIMERQNSKLANDELNKQLLELRNSFVEQQKKFKISQHEKQESDQKLHELHMQQMQDMRNSLNEQYILQIEQMKKELENQDKEKNEENDDEQHLEISDRSKNIRNSETPKNLENSNRNIIQFQNLQEELEYKMSLIKTRVVTLQQFEKMLQDEKIENVNLCLTHEDFDKNQEIIFKIPQNIEIQGLIINNACHGDYKLQFNIQNAANFTNCHFNSIRVDFVGEKQVDQSSLLLTDITTKNTNNSGITIERFSQISLDNIFVTNVQLIGLICLYCDVVMLNNVQISNCQNSGISIFYCVHTSVMDSSCCNCEIGCCWEKSRGRMLNCVFSVRDTGVVLNESQVYKNKNCLFLGSQQESKICQSSKWLKEF